MIESEKENRNKTPSKRKYPFVYEKLIPIAIGIIALGILLLLIVIIGVISGLIPGTGYSALLI